MVRQSVILAVLAGASVLVTSSAAPAGMITFEETQSQLFSFGLSPGSASLEFDQFDTQGGSRQLVGVGLSVVGGIGADVTAENDSPALPAPDFGLNLTGFMDIEFGPITTFFGFNQSFTTDGSVTESDGTPGSGSDFWDFGRVTVGDAADEMLTESLEAYEGTGSIFAEVFAAGGFTVTGATDSTMIISNFMGEGVVEVKYLYTVPAPGVLAALGLAGMRRRRRRDR